MQVLDRALRHFDAGSEVLQLRVAALEMRERAAAAREIAAAAREKALAVGALELGKRLFEEGSTANFAAAFALVQDAAEGGEMEAVVRLGEMLYAHAALALLLLLCV